MALDGCAFASGPVRLSSCVTLTFHMSTSQPEAVLRLRDASRRAAQEASKQQQHGIALQHALAAYNYCVQVHGSHFAAVPDTLALCQAAVAAGLHGEALRYLRVLRDMINKPIQQNQEEIRIKVLSVAAGVAASAGDEQQAAELLTELLAATAAMHGEGHPETQKARKALQHFTSSKPQVSIPVDARKFALGWRGGAAGRSSASSAEGKAAHSNERYTSGQVRVNVRPMMESVYTPVRGATSVLSSPVPTRAASLTSVSGSFATAPSTRATQRQSSPAPTTIGTSAVLQLPGAPPQPPSSDLTPPHSPYTVSPPTRRGLALGTPHGQAHRTTGRSPAATGASASAEALYARGMVLRLNGQLMQAVDALQAARAAFEGVKGVEGGNTSRAVGDVARVDMSLGLAWHQLGDLPAALRHYDAAYDARLRVACRRAGWATEGGTQGAGGLSTDALRQVAEDGDVQEALTHLNGVRRLLGMTPLDRDVDPRQLPAASRWAPEPSSPPVAPVSPQPSPPPSPVHPLSAPSSPDSGDGSAPGERDPLTPSKRPPTGAVQVRPLLSPRAGVAPYRITPLHPDEHLVNGIVCVGLYLLRRLTAAVGGKLEVGSPPPNHTLRPVGFEAVSLSPSVHGAGVLQDRSMLHAGPPTDPFSSLGPPAAMRSRAATDVGPPQARSAQLSLPTPSSTAAGGEGGGTSVRRRRPRYGRRASVAVEESRQRAWRASVGLSLDSPVSRQWTHVPSVRDGAEDAPPPRSRPSSLRIPPAQNFKSPLAAAAAGQPLSPLSGGGSRGTAPPTPQQRGTSEPLSPRQAAVSAALAAAAASPVFARTAASPTLKGGSAVPPPPPRLPAGWVRQDPCTWTPAQVGLWLAHEGMQEHIAVFWAAGVSGSDLFMLTCRAEQRTAHIIAADASAVAQAALSSVGGTSTQASSVGGGGSVPVSPQLTATPHSTPFLKGMSGPPPTRLTSNTVRRDEKGRIRAGTVTSTGTVASGSVSATGSGGARSRAVSSSTPSAMPVKGGGVSDDVFAQTLQKRLDEVHSSSDEEQGGVPGPRGGHGPSRSHGWVCMCGTCGLFAQLLV